MSQPRKKQDDRLLKRMSRKERRFQEDIRKRIASDPILRLT